MASRLSCRDSRKAKFPAPLQKIDLNDEKAAQINVPAGWAVLVKLKTGTSMEDARKILEPYRTGGAAMVVVASSAYAQRMFDMLAKEPPQVPQVVGNNEPKPRAMLVIAKQETFDQLWATPRGAAARTGRITQWKTTKTWNVLAKIKGHR